MRSFPKYVKDDNEYIYQIIGGEVVNSVYEPTKYTFECVSVYDGLSSENPRDFLITYNKPNFFTIEKVIFNDPATIVFWADGTKTVVKCGEEDIYDYQTGLLMCIAKKAFGNKGSFNDILREWIPEEVNAVENATNAFETFAKLLNATLVKEEK